MQQDWQFPGTGAGATPTAQASTPTEDPATQAASATRRTRSSQRAGKADAERKRRRRSAIAVTVALLLVVGAGFVVAQLVLPLFSGDSSESAVEDYPGPGHGSVQVVVNPGDTGAAIGATLADAGVVATAKAFVTIAAAHPDAGRIQPGTYALQLEMRATDALAGLLNPSNRVALKVTVPEGHRVEQVLERIASVLGVPIDEVSTAAQDTAALGLPAEAGGDLEGWLFPATYSFEPGTTPTSALTEMVAKTVQVLGEQGVPEGQRQELLIKASLVEREAKLDEDRPKMARAIENRLARTMLLQIDASVAYGLGKSGTELTRADLDTPGPYNTYTQVGLPAGPIANPGLASITAILNPVEGPWLFWVTVNPETGETLFAETNAEHEANRQLLRQWQSENQ